MSERENKKLEFIYEVKHGVLLGGSGPAAIGSSYDETSYGFFSCHENAKTKAEEVKKEFRVGNIWINKIKIEDSVINKKPNECCAV